MRVPRMKWNENGKEWSVLESPGSQEIVVFPINDDNQEKTWRWEGSTVMSRLDEMQVRRDRSGKDYVYLKRRPNEAGVVSVSSWFDSKYSSVEHGTGILKQLFFANPFSYPKSLYAVSDLLYITGLNDRNGVALDYFAGSGTTAHAVINLNRADKGNRKYILVEMGEYFDTVLKPRIQKVIYSADWKDGKPQSHETGISHCFKYLSLEGFEDTLNNLELWRSEEQHGLLQGMAAEAQDDYLLRYMLDFESRHLLSTERFRKPFDYELAIAVDSSGASVPTKVDLVETFNYLIGLKVQHIHAELERGFLYVEGRTLTGESTLVFWRDCDKLGYDEVLAITEKLKIRPGESEYDVIYINGDNTIPNHLTTEDGGSRSIKLRLIEDEFLARMFDVEDVL